MPRLLSSLLIFALSVWPSRQLARSSTPRARRGRGLPLRAGVDELQDAIEAPERARATSPHQWTGEVRFAVGERREVVQGRWRLTLDPMQRAQRANEWESERTTHEMSLDPTYFEAWQTQLEALLTLQTPGARLAVAAADAQGWRMLELRASTRPETIVQLDRSAVAQVLDAKPEAVTVELRVNAKG